MSKKEREPTTGVGLTLANQKRLKIKKED